MGSSSAPLLLPPPLRSPLPGSVLRTVMLAAYFRYCTRCLLRAVRGLYVVSSYTSIYLSKCTTAPVSRKPSAKYRWIRARKRTVFLRTRTRTVLVMYSYQESPFYRVIRVLYEYSCSRFRTQQSTSIRHSAVRSTVLYEVLHEYRSGAEVSAI